MPGIKLLRDVSLLVHGDQLLWYLIKQIETKNFLAQIKFVEPEKESERGESEETTTSGAAAAAAILSVSPPSSTIAVRSDDHRSIPIVINRRRRKEGMNNWDSILCLTYLILLFLFVKVLESSTGDCTRWSLVEFCYLVRVILMGSGGPVVKKSEVGSTRNYCEEFELGLSSSNRWEPCGRCWREI